MTKAPATITYASMMSRETVRIALMTAALNDLEVKLGDILYAYVPEFGKDIGKTAVIVRALYCLKLAGAAFRCHFARCIWSQFWGHIKFGGITAINGLSALFGNL